MTESNHQLNTVFVYGTLQRAYGNHSVMQQAGGKFICEAQTLDKYPLLVEGLPYLIDQCGQGKYVRGELYEVPNHGFNNLDRLEGHPSFYERRVRAFLCDKTEELNTFQLRKKMAWVYFLNSHQPRTQDTNFYESYEQGIDRRAVSSF